MGHTAAYKEAPALICAEAVKIYNGHLLVRVDEEDGDMSLISALSNYQLRETIIKGHLVGADIFQEGDLCGIQSFPTGKHYIVYVPVHLWREIAAELLVSVGSQNVPAWLIPTQSEPYGLAFRSDNTDALEQLGNSPTFQQLYAELTYNNHES